MIFVYYNGVIEQVLEEFNPDISVLADKWPDAIYFYGALVTDE
jgi:hypothetical protein